MRKYFEVIAKCGHVGRGKYLPGVFYEVAESASQAAQIVRGRGRVKHHHKDAILSVKEISKLEYKKGCEAKLDNEYFNCKNVQDQKRIAALIEDELVQEMANTPYADEDYAESRRNKVKYKLKKYKQNMQSYGRKYDDYYGDYAA